MLESFSFSVTHFSFTMAIVRKFFISQIFFLSQARKKVRSTFIWPRPDTILYVSRKLGWLTSGCPLRPISMNVNSGVVSKS